MVRTQGLNHVVRLRIVARRRSGLEADVAGNALAM
jgi:hypothetical protein